MRDVEVLIIGGGPAGLAAAVGAFESGSRDILILEREETLGGILRQCIHNGFGLHTFKEELTGPEYAARYVEKILGYGIAYQCDTMVTNITPEKIVTCVSRVNGLQRFKAKSVVLAMGCRERPRGSLATPGTRCAGIYTAGTAQMLVNMQGLMPGKRVVILGSGDIGLIMARRMTFVGAQVLACVELMPFSSGLKRNVVQCLDDYDIPLLLSHTVVDIKGKDRLESVVVAQVNEKFEPISGTERTFDCDTLLLSVGLIPENELSAMAGVEIANDTGGAVVDETLETSVSGIFSCGNVLHVHDLVDFVSEEAHAAGVNAHKYADGAFARAKEQRIEVVNGEGVMGIVPQFISRDGDESTTLMFRPRAVYQNATVCVDLDGEQSSSKKHRILAPGEMASVKIDWRGENGAKRADVHRLSVRVQADG